MATPAADQGHQRTAGDVRVRVRTSLDGMDRPSLRAAPQSRHRLLFLQHHRGHVNCHVAVEIYRRPNGWWLHPDRLRVNSLSGASAWDGRTLSAGGCPCPPSTRSPEPG